MIWQVRACQSDDNRQPIVGLRHPPPPPQSRQSPRNDVTSARPAAASIGFATREPANWIIEHYQRERERERERVAVLSFISADTRRRVLFPFTISPTSTKFRVVNFRQLTPLCATKLKQVSTVLIARGRIAAALLSYICLLSMSLTARLGKFSILGHKKLLTRA